VRHLTDLDELREGIGLRAFAQQDPLVAYKKEAHDMYQELVAAISHDIVYSIYHVQLMIRPPVPVQRMQVNRGEGASAPQQVRRTRQPGRNDPCWCGSGKKYKHCHMRADQGRDGAGAAAPARSAAATAPTARPPASGNRQTGRSKASRRK